MQPYHERGVGRLDRRTVSASPQPTQVGGKSKFTSWSFNNTKRALTYTSKQVWRMQSPCRQGLRPTVASAPTLSHRGGQVLTTILQSHSQLPAATPYAAQSYATPHPTPKENTKPKKKKKKKKKKKGNKKNRQPRGPPGPHPYQCVVSQFLPSVCPAASSRPGNFPPIIIITGWASGQPLRAGLGTATAVVHVPAAVRGHSRTPSGGFVVNSRHPLPNVPSHPWRRSGLFRGLHQSAGTGASSQPAGCIPGLLWPVSAATAATAACFTARWL